MSLEKTGVPQLEGSSNYLIWAIKMKSFLIKEGLDDTLDMETPVGNHIKRAKKAQSYVILHCKAGPTLHIQHDEYVKSAWDKLESLFKPQGFTSEFLLCNEFFSAKPENFKGLESYLNEIKRLMEELKSRNLGLPAQIVISWILSNLDDEFEGFVSNITQSLRKDPQAYTFDTLTSATLDEAKRHKHKNHVNAAIGGRPKKGFKALNKGRVTKKPWKKEKGQICKICSKTSHKSENYYLLHPEKAPESWKKKLEKLKQEKTKERSPTLARERRKRLQVALVAKLAIKEPI